LSERLGHARADIYAPVRAGSDIAFLGGLIRYILENDLWFKDYVLNYTNIAAIVHDDFRDTSELGGLFSGFDDGKHKYEPSSWQYRGQEPQSSSGGHFITTGEAYAAITGLLNRPCQTCPEPPRCRW
jgi:formate dehydrogenase major subunit